MSMYGWLYRHLLWPAFDGLIKGRSTRRYLEDFERTQWLPRRQLEALQFEALRHLLRHAAETCPYYAHAWRARGLDPRRLTSLEQFLHWPLTTRETLRQHGAEMRSTTPYATFRKSTGGSTGEPVSFVLNADSNDRRTALMHRAYGWAGGGIGTKQFYIWGGALPGTSAWKRAKLAAHAWFERRTMVNCFDMTPARMEQHARLLARARPDAIVAYTNPLYEFARFLERAGIRPWSPRGIIVGAEKLHLFQRQLIERVFRAPVFETYGSREVMLIGAECPEHQGLHLSMENLLVEVLDDEGRPVPEGEEGNVVITDLYNLAQPFIRYVNGDRAIAGFGTCRCGRGLPTLRAVAGRRLDVLHLSDGRQIPGEFFPHLLKEFPGVQRFRVIQPARDRVILEYVVDEADPPDAAELRLSIEAQLGAGASLELRRVSEIPLTAAGKHRVVVSQVSGPEAELSASPTDAAERAGRPGADGKTPAWEGRSANAAAEIRR